MAKTITASAEISRYANYPNIKALATHALDKVDNFADDLLPALEADLTGNAALKTGFEGDTRLLGVWEDIKYLKGYRNDIDFLRILNEIKNNSALRKHLLGETYESGKAAGGHWYEAINQSLARKSALNPKGNPNPTLYAFKGTPNEMEAFWIDIKDAGGSFLPKEANLSTFFPKTWDESKIFEEIAFAVKNKTPKGKVYQGVTSDGVISIEITYDGTNVKSAYPSFTNGFKQ